MKKPSALQTVATFALTVAAIAFSAPASAQFQKPEDALQVPPKCDDRHG